MSHALFGESQLAGHDRSVDMIRVLRRSVRCFYFGLLGALPVVGLGLAWQAFLLCDLVMAELGENWRAPRMVWCWILGVGAILGLDCLFGLDGAFCAFVLMLGLQSVLVWRRFPQRTLAYWNAGLRHLRWGLVFANAGYYSSLGLLILAAVRLSRVDWR